MGSRYSTSNEKSNYTGLGLAVLILTIISSVGYFTQTNAVASLGYEMRANQKTVDRLTADNQKMKIVIADESSFKNIGENSRAEKMNLVGVADQRYLVISSSSLASR